MRGSLISKEVKDYIDEDVAEKLLGRHLGAVNLPELKNNGGFEVLVEFARETFRISWNGKNLDGVKSLDTMTKDLVIPSRSGSDVMNMLTTVSQTLCLTFLLY